MANRESDDAIEAAREIELDLPEVCLTGVVENRRLLADHAALLDRFFADRAEG